MKTFLVVLILSIVASIHAQSRADALVLYRNGEYEQAIKVCLQELSELEPSKLNMRMNSYSVLGWSYLRLGQYQNALNYAVQARKESQYDVRIIEIQAEALFSLGQFAEALEFFELYVATNSTGDRIDLVYFFMGEIFLRMNKFNHADISFSTAIHHNPEIASWWARLAYTREQLDNKAGARQAYEKAIELQPSLEEARLGLERLSF